MIPRQAPPLALLLLLATCAGLRAQDARGEGPGAGPDGARRAEVAPQEDSPEADGADGADGAEGSREADGAAEGSGRLPGPPDAPSPPADAEAEAPPADVAEVADGAPLAPLQRLAQALARSEDLAARLDDAVDKLYDRCRRALEVLQQDPKHEPAYERLGRDEQIAWRLAHLQGYAETLIKVHTILAGVPPGMGIPLPEMAPRPPIAELLVRYAAAHAEVRALEVEVTSTAALPEPLAIRLGLAAARWEQLRRRFRAGVFEHAREHGRAPPLEERALLPSGFFARSPAGELAPGESYLERFADRDQVPGQVPPGSEPAAPSPTSPTSPTPPSSISAHDQSYVLFDVYLLHDLHRVLDPVRRELRDLALEQDRLEIEQIRELSQPDRAAPAVEGAEPEASAGAPTPAAPVDGATLLGRSPPALLALRIEHFEQRKAALASAMQESYQRYLQQARELGQEPDPAALLSPQSLGFTLPPELGDELLTALQLAAGEVKEFQGQPLPALRAEVTAVLEGLEQSLTALGPRAGQAPGQTTGEASAQALPSELTEVRRQLLLMEVLGKREHLELLRDTIRREDSRLEVAERLLVGAVLRIGAAQRRLDGLEERWWEAAARHYGWSVIEVALIVLAAWLFVRVISFTSARVVRRFSHEHARGSEEAEARARTIQGVLMTAVRIVVFVTAFLMVLGLFDVNTQPLLLATGGITLAIGFGAQSLVRDFFSGFFILLENQFKVGDVVRIGGNDGLVEGLDLRTTRLRSADGTLHVIPNGEILQVSNLTHEWARAFLLVGVGYREDPDQVTAVLNRLGEELKADPAWSAKLLEPLAVWGIETFGASSVDFRVAGKVRPGEQWAVAREYRRRVKMAFDREGIEIPFPYVNTVHIGEPPSRPGREGAQEGESAPGA